MRNQKNNEEISKYLKCVHERLKSIETDLFRVHEYLNPLTRLLARGSKVSMYLKKEHFESLFPVLRDIVLPENNVSLIVDRSILENEQKEPYESLPYMVDPEQQKNSKPRVSNLLDSDNVFLNFGKHDDLPSLLLFNHRSYLLETSDSYFLCALNAPYDAKQAERLDLYYRVLSILKSESIPFKEIEAQKISSQRNINPFMNNNNSLTRE